MFLPYHLLALIAVLVLVAVHLSARKMDQLNFISHGRFLSTGGGIAIAYVFVDLLPKLCKSDLIVQQNLAGVFPYFERHVYVMALTGFLLFFAVDRSGSILERQRAYWFDLASYALFNFLVGYAVTDKDDPEVQPLILFTIAMSLHYFTNDYSLNQTHEVDYQRWGKWILILSLFSGWLLGVFLTLPPTAVALVSAFIGGGVMMNVTRHELPEENPHSLPAFLFSAAAYTCILLSFGS